MRALVVGAALTAAMLSACTVKNTTIERAAAPAPVVVKPAPTVVYQAPPTVVHEPLQQAPSRSVNVNYTGGDAGFEMAVEKAHGWCGQNFGNAAARLVADDRNAGRATFTCVAL